MCQSEHPSLIRSGRRPLTWQILSFQLRFLKECMIIQPRKQIAGKGWMNSLGRELRFTTCALKAIMELETEFFMGHVYEMFSFYLLALWMEWKQLSSLLLPVRGWGPRSGWVRPIPQAKRGCQILVYARVKTPVKGPDRGTQCPSLSTFAS